MILDFVPLGIGVVCLIGGIIIGRITKPERKIVAYERDPRGRFIKAVTE